MKKIIIFIAGLLTLIAMQISVNLFVFDRSMMGVMTAPFWILIYFIYANLAPKLLKIKK